MQATATGIKVHRAPRKWPYIPPEPITIQAMQPPSKPSGVTVLVTVAGMVGLLISAVIYSQFGGGASSAFILGFLAISGLSMIASLFAFYVQLQSSNEDARELARRYKGYLDGTERSIAALSAEEHAARKRNDAPLAEAAASIGRHPERAWQRRPDDPDFLAVRIGAGDSPAWVRVALADRSTSFTPSAKDLVAQHLQQRARTIVEHYQSAHDVPIALPVRQHAALALVNGASGTTGASALARSMVGQVVLHHAPQDVSITVLSPSNQAAQWSWIAALPTTGGRWPQLGARPEERTKILAALLAELSRRQQSRSDRGYTSHPDVFLPHLLIVVDSFAQSGETDPLVSPALALALRQGKDLGASVLSVHSVLQQAPAEASVAVEVAHKRIEPLGPTPAAETSCRVIDAADTGQCQTVVRALERLELEEEASLGLPNQVPLLRLLDPPIHRPDAYPVAETWRDAHKKLEASGGKRSFDIPIGRKIGQEPLHLDLANDGPHGLLIGQTGSGKSELLRSMIAALAITYPPDMVNLVLVDYKGGLAFDAFESLPHTVAYLTNMAQPGQTKRFLAMLDAEIVRRQVSAKQEVQPELFVIIDEFAEMVSRRAAGDANEDILDNLLSIARLGRELGVHLLFAAQRPDGSVIQRLRGYVQYRICLRTNSEEDSREVVGRPDAAQLPVEIPGRGYLLRGDNELVAFQAARISVPFFQSDILHISGGKPDLARSSTLGRASRTAERIISERISREQGVSIANRWPAPLPTPSPQAPTPLVLVTDPPARDGGDGGITGWNTRQSRPLRAMEAPLGLYDRPSEQRQDWFIADLFGHAGRMLGGPLLVMGDLNSGKTTALQTLLFSLAHTHSPAELRWYALDPNGSLAEFGGLPQLADVGEHGVRNLIDGQDDAEFRAFTARFERAARIDPASRPALLLVVDDYDDLGARYSKALHDLAQHAIRGRDRKVYLAIAASRPSYDGLPQAIINGMTTRVALYMSDRDQLRALISGRVPAVLDAAPGRGLVQTRRSLDEIQIATPVPGRDDAERLERLATALQQAAQRWR